MAADDCSVKRESSATGRTVVDKLLGMPPSERVPPGTTITELIAAVGELKILDG